MIGDAEARAAADSCVFTEVPPDLFEEMQGGQLACWIRDGQWATAVMVRNDLPAEARTEFERWARQRVYMVLHTDDPEADGWFRRSDDGWQITGGPADMPADPFA